MGTSRSGGGTTTQSAIDLQAMPTTFEKMKSLANKIADDYATDFMTELAMGRAKQRAQTFRDEDYVDLLDFAQLLASEYTGTTNLRSLATDLAEHLSNGRAGSPIVANYHGHSRPDAQGLSIYLPARSYSPFYDRQDFALSGWGSIIRRMNHVKEPSISAIADQMENAPKKGGPTDTFLIQCPICRAQMELPSNLEAVSVTIATKSVRDMLAEMMDMLRTAFASPNTESNAWIDLPCPNCRHTFQYNFRTGESRK